MRQSGSVSPICFADASEWRDIGEKTIYDRRKDPRGRRPWLFPRGLERGKARGSGMIRILKVLIVLAILGFIGLTGFAYLGDLSPEQSEVSVPVRLDG